jgi:hypothetical protein
MPRKITRPPCACGCGLTRRANSKYASDECRQQFYNHTLRDQRKALRHAIRLDTGGRHIIIHDPLCADPYRIGKMEFMQHRDEYLAIPGVKIEGIKV